jgi:saccharopine dehydrogenase-like NADP-dependent oxidoreductase
MDHLFEFLTTLSMDPQRQDEFARNPDAVMTDAGLDPGIQSLLAAGNADALQQALSSGPWTRCACASDPGYDPPPSFPGDAGP